MIALYMLRGHPQPAIREDTHIYHFNQNLDTDGFWRCSSRTTTSPIVPYILHISYADVKLTNPSTFAFICPRAGLRTFESIWIFAGQTFSLIDHEKRQTFTCSTTSPVGTSEKPTISSQVHMKNKVWISSGHTSVSITLHSSYSYSYSYYYVRDRWSFSIV